MPPDDDREAEDAARRRMLIMIGVGILIAVLGGWLMFALHVISPMSNASSKGIAIATGRRSKSRADGAPSQNLRDAAIIRCAIAGGSP